MTCLRYVAGKRLARGLLTVIDATNVQPEARKPLVELAREHDVLPVAIVLEVPERVCHERNGRGPIGISAATSSATRSCNCAKSLRYLEREGFRYVHRLSFDDTPEAATGGSTRSRGSSASRSGTIASWDTGPFDIIGDVHGCFDELAELLESSSATRSASDRKTRWSTSRHAAGGRKAVFLGDLVDRGPKVVEVLKLVMSMVRRARRCACRATTT